MNQVITLNFAPHDVRRSKKRSQQYIAVHTDLAAYRTRRQDENQSVKAMPNGEFQQSKTDVLEFVSALIGVEADELARAA